MTAPADPPDRIAEILREILALAHHEENSKSQPSETKDEASNPGGPDAGDVKSDEDRNANWLNPAKP